MRLHTPCLHTSGTGTGYLCALREAGATCTTVAAVQIQRPGGRATSMNGTAQLPPLRPATDTVGAERLLGFLFGETGIISLGVDRPVHVQVVWQHCLDDIWLYTNADSDAPQLNRQEL